MSNTTRSWRRWSLSLAYGEKLFCRAVDAWKSERVQKCVADMISRMPPALGEVGVKKLFATLATVTVSMDKALLARNRVITVGFKGLVLEIEAGSASEELSLRLFVHIKERMTADKLPSLPVETGLQKLSLLAFLVLMVLSYNRKRQARFCFVLN